VSLVLNPDFRDLLSAFIDAHVEFLIVGGYALAVHRLPRATKGSDGNRVASLAADASRRAALLVACIHPVCALLPPCRAGASTPKQATLFPSEP
jgi:hypothetical protein